MSNGIKHVDNHNAGGMILGVDLASGAFAPSAKAELGYGAQTVAAHPYSGAVFAGRSIPYWAELKALVARAAEAVAPLRMIGWDVAAAPDGPVLVEANHHFDVFLMQDFADGLRRTLVGRTACERLGLSYALRAVL